MGRTAWAGRLGGLYQARSERWAEAVKIRQADQRLGQLTDQIDEARQDLEPVKLYPPYPADEPRRAAAIRKFNGVAAEVARLVPEEKLVTLGEQASTGEATKALEGLARARAAAAQKRTQLVARFSSADSTESDREAEAASGEVRAALEQDPGAGIVRPASTLLGEIL